MPDPGRHPVDALLQADGPIARALGAAYEPRPEQIGMATAVEKALADRSHLLVEAGTGVGKSFAYLIPAAMRCVEKGETVVIATNTISLQEQLVEKDVPLIRAALGLDSDDPSMPPALRPVLVKGRGNYVSIRRLKLASARQGKLFTDAAAKRSLHVIEDWAYETKDGSLSTLPSLERPGVWDRVQSDSGNCMGRKCPHHGQCFYQRARRTMEQANLLICNHALFFSDLALRARDVGFLPKYDHVILDEAHNIEDVAAEHFGISLTEGRVNHLLSSLYHERTGKGYLAQLELLDGDIEPIDRAVKLVRAAERASRAFFEDAERLLGSEKAPGGRVRAPGVIENPLTPAMNDLAVRLRALKDLARNEADRFELNAFMIRAREVSDACEALIDQTAPGYCYWVEGAGQDGGRRRVRMACSPVEVGPLLKEHLFGGEHSVVLTSATLATRTVRSDEPSERAETAFAHIMERLGCEGARILQLGSPFDYAEQVEVFVDRSMPSPGWTPRERHAGARGAGGGDTFTRELTARILDHLAATEGGAFILFTSFSQLGKTADALRGPLASLDMPMFVQGRDGSRSQILEAFRGTTNGVLLGAASFWQGVDVRGETLRNVIITRLPFDPPGRPLTEARLERIRDRGGDPFREDSLPRAVIRFKQGFGRLIRSHGDQGRVVVLDPRVVTKGYGRRFLAALPSGVNIRLIPEVEPDVGAGEDLGRVWDDADF
ncbi:MAG: ATP-dependent DNA helicase [Phycisphaerales bacterium JB059]